LPAALGVAVPRPVAVLAVVVVVAANLRLRTIL